MITGATGMVGEGVMHECLQDEEIAEVLVINRRPGNVQHPKLKEVILTDFFKFSDLNIDFTAYQACFFCLGVSSVGLSQADYYHLTYELTMQAAQVLASRNPNLVFCYVTGAGTDSTEKGRSAWARVKGKTENDLMKLSFKKAYMFRPAFMTPTPGLKNVKSYYKYIGWLAPVIKITFPQYISSLRELGLAMINAVKKGYSRQILEVKDIKILAKA